MLDQYSTSFKKKTKGELNARSIEIRAVKVVMTGHVTASSCFPEVRHNTMADEELASYRLQFQQVEAALLGDPDNEELKKLKADLEEVIALQEELTSATASGSVNDVAPVSVPVKKYEIGDRVMAPLA
ncbi:hypothetical protein KIN20_028575 [Parelaphostrongylus tenuis]|uniref:Uncharacterized protein n=1 Tax=Parelaphostrongylus tenuis TaxID=148309 RepID=A0AAD5WEX6_PARTN|nr:hypothetical protein KIN20_028575 [Parelaphostrongylus tenuis]